MPVIAEVIAASKEFISGDSVIVALKPSSMALSTGKVTLIIGPSGSGKTTLLRYLAISCARRCFFTVMGT